ncbi:MAG: T9SS type A sorting domain-containing protein [Aquaticitalea sp.]
MRTILTLSICLFAVQIQAQDWQFNAQFIHSDVRQQDYFGNAVGMQNDTIVVAAYNQDNGNNYVLHNEGAIYVFSKDVNDQWSQTQKIIAQDRFANDNFGWHLDYDGKTIATSSEYNGRDATGANNIFRAGAAYIFTRNSSGEFIQSQKLVATDRSLQAGFGSDIDLEGDVMAIGAFNDSFDTAGGNEQHFAGAVYIFERDASGIWTQTQKLVASDRDAEDGFGYSVKLDGNYLVVGAYNDEDGIIGQPNASDSGSAYIFEKQPNGTWTEQQKISASDRVVDDEFGHDVDIDDDVLVVSTRYQDQNETNNDFIQNGGAVYVYNKDISEQWVQVKKLTAADREPSAYFGDVVAIDEDYIMVGAYRDDNHGSVYVFGDGSGADWSDEEKFFPNTITYGARFGRSITFSGDKAVIGAVFNDYNGMISTGAAFLYERDPNLGFITPTQDNDKFLYPVPTTGPLTIKNLNVSMGYTIYDLMGRKLLTGIYEPNEILDISYLATGRYFLKLSNGAVMDVVKH